MELAGELDDGVEPLLAERVRALPAVQRHAVAEHELLGLGAVPGKDGMRHSVCFERDVVMRHWKHNQVYAWSTQPGHITKTAQLIA